MGWPKLRTPAAPNQKDKKQPERTWDGDCIRVQLPPTGPEPAFAAAYHGYCNF